MRITRTIADEAAKKMASAKFDSKIKQLELKQRDLCEKIAKDYIPIDVINLAEKHPRFFNMSNCVYVSTENSYGTYLPGNSRYPNFANGYSMPISKSDYLSVRKMKEEREHLSQNQSRLQDRISDTLFSLRTIEKVKKEFPEALKYISCEEKSLPALQIDDLRNLFK